MSGTSGFQIKVDGADLAADVAGLLVSAYVDDSRNLPDMFLLRFRDADRIVVAKSKVHVGSAVTIAVKTADGNVSADLISGEVTALEADFDSGGTFTIIRGYDHTHRFFRGLRTETYTQVTASDVAKKVAQRAQVQIGTIDATSTVFEHLSQCGSTDWDFLSGLAREVGYQIAVHEAKFEFRKPVNAADAPNATGQAVTTDPLILQLGTDLLRFRAVVTSAEQVKEVQVRGWDVTQKKALVATAPAKTTSAVLPSVNPTDLAHTFGDQVYVAAGVPYRSQAEVDSAASALANDLASAFAEFEGVARGNPALRAGTAFSVTSIGEPWDGKYTISTSRHVYEPTTGYTTAFSVTGTQERSLYGLTAGGSPNDRSPGVVVAQVSDANDPEKQGRVKVTFPWLSDTYVSDWARTVQPGAGKDRGAMTVPEVGDEVLVAFEHDMRRPYVIGGLFNGVDTPKSSSVDLVDGSGAINRRSFVSRLGHRIDLLDQKGQSDGISMKTSDDKVQLVIDAAGTKVTVHSDGSVLVEGKTGVVVDAGQSKLELKGGEVSVTAQGALTLKGAQAKLEGSAQAEVKGGSLCSVTGGLVKIN